MNNKKVIIAIITLLLIGVIGISYSYFVASTTRNNLTDSTVSTTVNIDNTTFTVEGKLSFDDLNIYPGHKNVSSIKVTATGDHTINYNLVWDGINSLERLDYKVYKTTTEIIPTTTCNKLADANNGLTKYYEECSVANIDSLGEVISSGSINKNTEITKEILKSNESITASKEGTVVYYYVVLEFPNEDRDQNIDMNSKFEGIVTGESSEVEYAKPEVIIKNSDSTENTITLNIEGIKADREIDKYFYKVGNAEYQETKNTNIKINGLNPNTEYIITVYTIDRAGTKSEELSTKIKTKEILTMTQVLNKYKKNTSRNGEVTAPFTGSTPTTVYSAADDDGTSYMFAGVNPNNWVKIGSMYWRIIRFNGDGTMRLIYSGASSPETSGPETQIGTSRFSKDSKTYYDNAYVGFMYGSTVTWTGGNSGSGVHSTSYANAHANEQDSGIKKVLDTWYTNNLTSYASVIDTNAGFCGDRKVSTVSRSGYGTLGYGTNATAYVTVDRYLNSSWNELTSYTPSLKCSQSADLYTKKGASKGNKALTNPIGLITADEYALAGGGSYARGNSSYYNTTFWLHTGQDYWTMSPSEYTAGAIVFRVYSAGYFGGGSVNYSHGVRPVINLKSSTTFATGGTGTSSNPYVANVN